MTDKISPIGFVPRFVGAFGQFFKFLGNGDYAARCQLVSQGEKLAREQAPEIVTETVEVIREVEKPTLASVSSDGALQLLQLLQQESRFVDFIQEDISQYADDEIGGAVRQIHTGCASVLKQYFEIETALSQNEGERVQIESGYNPHMVRLEGRVQGEGPFAGTIIHPGWKVTNVKLPQISSTEHLAFVAPAQVEV